MKTMKKLASLLLALIMVMSLALSVSAAEEQFTITIPAGDTHNYEIYQIFTGDYHEKTTDNGTEKVLSNIVWGVNGTGTLNNPVPQTVLDELKAATGSDAQKLAVISKHVTLTNPHKTINGGETAQYVTVDPGYYLIKDVKDSVTGHDAYTTYVVQVVDDVTVNRKTAKPTVDKQVWDETADAEAGNVGGWGETADHAINERFKFKLIATLTADTDYDAYPSYKVVFNDTMSAGITFESIDSVTVDGVPLTATQYSSTATANQAGGPWSLTIADIKAISGANLTDGAIIEVIYNAHLNENAVVGNVDDNLNTVYLQYSNNPNAGGEGDLGTTSDDTVWVFTYQIDSTKYHDEAKAGNELDGAGFTLYQGDVAIYLLYDEADKVYRPVAADTAGSVTEMTTANGGRFNVAGLDVGTYILKETNVPAGYNKCDDITIVISATHAENADTTSATTRIEMKVNNEDATENKVVNNAGAQLPETGGMGTTLFYVVGGILVAAAAVLLVTKKRMAN